jgi:hypothetical protein
MSPFGCTALATPPLEVPASATENPELPKPVSGEPDSGAVVAASAGAGTSAGAAHAIVASAAVRADLVSRERSMDAVSGPSRSPLIDRRSGWTEVQSGGQDRGRP